MSNDNYRSGQTVIASGLLVSWSKRGATLTISTSGQQINIEISAPTWKQFADTVRFAEAERMIAERAVTPLKEGKDVCK